MKKFAFIMGFISCIYAANIHSNSYYLNISGGSVNIYSSETTASAAVGYYYYDPNRYLINNRFSLEFNYIDSKADFYITNFKIDWIKNNEKFSPFIGLNTGYLYFNQNNSDYSTGVWGAQGGIIVNISKKFEIQFSATWQKAFSKKNIWDKSIRTFKGGININF
ncbi:hypothetical protein [Nautilia sp.]